VVIVKRLFALLVAAILMAGVVSAYAEEAPSASGQGIGTTGTDVTPQKDVKKTKKTKKHHKHKKKTKKTK